MLLRLGARTSEAQVAASRAAAVRRQSVREGVPQAYDSLPTHTLVALDNDASSFWVFADIAASGRGLCCEE